MKRFPIARALAALPLALSLLLGNLPAARPASASALSQATGQITFTLETPAYSFEPAGNGQERLILAGFHQSGQAGSPALPVRVVALALPPDADPGSLTLEVLDAPELPLEGRHSLENASAPRASGGRPEVKPQPVISKPPLQAAAPLEPVSLLPPGQLRTWRFARLQFSPVRYQPETGQVSLITSATVIVHFNRLAAAQASGFLNDPAVEEEAASLFANYEEARAWYTGGVRASAALVDYAILTSGDIFAQSAEINNLVALKQRQGFRPAVYLETTFLGLGAGDPADRLRGWLKQNYLALGLRYALIIESPVPYNPADANGSTAPMKMCWPRPEPDTQEAPTDYYYADLTGNWDADGDGVPCEAEDYALAGGVDLAPELLVGRIPVYNHDISALDAILKKVIAYESSTDLEWRKSALLPMSFSDQNTNGAYLGEQMQAETLNPAGFSTWSMYQTSSAACSSLPTIASSQPLLGGGAVRDRWAANDYGLVVWWGHGNEQTTAIGYETCWGLPDPILLSSSQTTALDDAHPAFTYQNSCLNGRPETPDNLGYSLLRKGAVATVSASRVSWYIPGETDFRYSPSNAGLGYEYARRLAGGQTAGEALFGAKNGVPIAGSDTAYWLMNLYDFNLYGDPSAVLVPSPAPVLTTVEPARALTGSEAMTITLSGENFLPTTLVRWNGAALPTTYHSPTRLTALVSASRLAVPGEIEITASQAPPGGYSSEKIPFLVDQACQPAAQLTTAAPDTRRSDGPGSTQTVSFYPGLSWNESGPEIAYQLPIALNGAYTARLDPGATSLDLFLLSGEACRTANLLSAGDSSLSFSAEAGSTYFLLVDGAAASEFTLALECPDCTNPLPELTSSDPPGAYAGQAGLVLRLNGRGFTPGSQARWDGQPLVTRFLSPSSLEADLPASWLALPRDAELTVFNPLPGGGLSAGLTFPIGEDPAGSCLPAADLPFGTLTSQTGSEAGWRSWINSYPGLSLDASGPEFAYRFQSPYHEPVSFELVNAAPGQALFLLDDAAGKCKAASLRTGGLPALAFSAEAGQAYYLLVDGKTAGPFSLSVKCAGCANPGPELAAISPAQAVPGSGFTLTARGQDFLPGAVLRWDGLPLDTTFISPQELQAVVTDQLAALPNPGAWIDALNPGVNGRSSNRLGLSLQAAAGQCFPARSLLPGESDTRRNNAAGSTDAIDRYPLSARNLSGPEVTYQITASQDGPLRAYLSGLSADLDLLVLKAESQDCLSQNALAYGNARVEFEASAGQSYYLVVDGYAGASGGYTLFLNDDRRFPAEGEQLLDARPVFAWASYPGAAAYRFQVSTRADLRYPFINTIVTIPKAIPSAALPAGKPLYWRVIPLARVSFGYRSLAPLPTWAVSSAKPPATAGLISPVSGARVKNLRPRLDWSSPLLPAGAIFDHYQLQVAFDSFFARPVLDASLSDYSRSEYTFTSDLPAGFSFYWRVRAFNQDGSRGAWSATRSFRTPLAAPVLIDPTNEETLDPRQHAFNWDPVGGATGYNLQVSYSPIFSTVLVNISTTRTTYTRTLRSTRPFYWRVRATGSLYGPGPWSEVWKFYDSQ